MRGTEESMNVMLVSIAALGCYLLGGLGQGIRIKGGTISRRNVLGITALGAIFQAAALWLIIYRLEGINLGVFTIASLTTLMVTLVVLLASIKHASEGLLVLILPITMLSVLTAWLFPFNHIFLQPPSSMVVHVLISVMAYGVLMAAVFQSFLLFYQEHQLRRHSQKRLLKALPPLQTMECLMFDFLMIGFLLLTLSLLSGFFYLDNMFAQRLIHKTVLSIIAWCMFGVLLLGRRAYGWRGIVAMRWMIAGFLLLILSYFGWRLIVDLLLSKY
ncbi:MAG: cytochrome c biogenesis protein CcsA [Endozoicomonas sp. (ex Botrylloides leachii)]|nr:cytochrome c biogenesis protein CcsA [Endozoicomonas sp. (ex Botrylloides leachii)]